MPVQLGTTWVIAEPLDRSTDRLAVDAASFVCDTLWREGLAPFVTDRRGDRVQLGVTLDERPAALAALAAAPDADRWYLRWFGGSRDGLVPLTDAADDRRVERARAMSVFRPVAIGDRALADDIAVDISFWQEGAFGRYELVGTRGHERFEIGTPWTTETIRGVAFPGRETFPVERDLTRVSEPVDLVYTWVDGADPDWQASFRATAEAEGRSLDEGALDPARYRSNDELRMSLRSVWMYLGWVRRIFVVTAGQRPSWLAGDDRITVVDHTGILPPSALPTFNSHAIEAALHRIDGLAEQFVYFNDDMFVGRPLRPEVFFTPNGLARVFQSGSRVVGVEDDTTLAFDTAARRGRELLDQRFGRVVAGKPLHAPYPLLRSALQHVEEEFPTPVVETQHSRFRSPRDLSLAANFGPHVALATGRAVLGDIRSDYVHLESPRLNWHLDRIRLSGEIDTYCLNETGVAGGTPPANAAAVDAFLDAVLPLPAPWERG